MATEEEKKDGSGASEAEAKDASGAVEGYKFLVSEPDFQAQFGFGAPLFDYSLPDFVEKKSDVLERSLGNASPSSSFTPASLSSSSPQSSASSSSQSASSLQPAPPSSSQPTVPSPLQSSSSFPAEAFPVSAPSYFAGAAPELSFDLPVVAASSPMPNIPPLCLPVLLSLTPADFSQPLIALNEEQKSLARQIFEKADLNANGFLEPEELKLALAGNNFSASQKTVLTILKNVIDRVLVKRGSTDLPGGGEILTTQDDFCLALASEYSRGVANVREQRSLSTPVQEQSYRFSPTEAGGQSGNAEIASRATSGVNRLDAMPLRQSNFRPELYGNGGVPTVAVRVRAVALNSTSDPYFASIVASLVSLAPRTVASLLNENTDKTCDVVFNRRFEKGITVVPPCVSDIMRYGLAFEYGYWFLVLDKAYGIYLATKSRLATKLGEASGSFSRAGEAMQAVLARGVEALVLHDLDDELLIDQISKLASKTEPLVVISSSRGRAYLPLFRDNFPYPVVGFNPQKKMVQVYCLPFIGCSDEMHRASEVGSKLFVWLTLSDFRVAFRALYLPAQNPSSSTPSVMNWLRGK